MARLAFLISIFAFCGFAQTNDIAVVTNAAPLLVTATHLTRTPPDVAGFVSVLDRGSTEMASALTIDQAVAHLSGVDYQSHGLPGASAKLDFRGLTQDFGSKSTLFIMNGRRLNDPFQGNAEVSQINIRNIDSITVLRGPASYLYGTGAMGGLVSLKMRDGLGKDPFAEFSVEGGNYGTFTTSVGAGGQFDDVDLYGGATYFNTDGYHPYPDTPKVDWENQDYFLNLGWRPSEWDTFRLEGGYYTGNGFDREGDRDVKRYYEQLSWIHDWNTPRAQTTTIRLNNSQEDSCYHIAPAGGALTLNLANLASPYYPYTYMPLDYVRDYHFRSTGGDVTHQMEFNDIVSFAIGADFRQDAAKLRDYHSYSYPKENSFGLFGESDIKLTDTLTLTLGLRLDKTESFDLEYSPRAALLWHVTPDTELYASVTKAFRTPGLSDRYIDTISIYYPGSPLAVALPYKGNPYLKPSSLIAYETGFRQRIDSPVDFIRHAELSVALFYNDIKDDFDFRRSVTESGTLQMQVENASRAHTCGIETEFRTYFTHGFELLAYASYMQGRYDKTDIAADSFNSDIKGHDIPNLAPWKLGGGLQWHSGAIFKNWRDFNMSHGLFIRFEDERYAGSDNAEKLDAYTVFDWASRFQLTRNIALTLTIANLFDQDYRVYDIISPTGYPAIGRTYMIGLEGKF